uniref:Peptidase A2 domain-containing protein n=1 Tax=Strongyloides venezuelensis TaxID=75913 RepID=A0A0K0FZA2_STRVS
MINDNDCEALIDTGATINVMSRKLCNEPALPMESSSIKITTANDNMVSTVGQVTHSCNILGKKHILTYNTLFCDRMTTEITPKCNLYIVNNTTIPYNACSIIHVKVIPNVPIKKNVILDLNSYWKNTNHILTFEQICSINDGMIPLVLFNAGRNPVQLYKDTHIGMIHTIQELNDDTLLVNSEVIPDDAD